MAAGSQWAEAAGKQRWAEREQLNTELQSVPEPGVHWMCQDAGEEWCHSQTPLALQHWVTAGQDWRGGSLCQCESSSSPDPLPVPPAGPPHSGPTPAPSPHQHQSRRLQSPKLPLRPPGQRPLPEYDWPDRWVIRLLFILTSALTWCYFLTGYNSSMFGKCRQPRTAYTSLQLLEVKTITLIWLSLYYEY